LDRNTHVDTSKTLLITATQGNFAVCCNVLLQCLAVRCRVLQCAAACCSFAVCHLLGTEISMLTRASSISSLQHSCNTVHFCSALQCVHFDTSNTHFITATQLQHSALLQCVAVCCCSVLLQCVAVCCSVCSLLATEIPMLTRATRISSLQHSCNTVHYCSALQCVVAVCCCSALQCVAVCVPYLRQKYPC